MEQMTIGEFAREAGLTAKALRLYDEMGLIEPAEVDPATGYRYYAPAQLERARLVARLRWVGMPLARIRQVADLPLDAAAAAVASYWRQVEADTRTRRTRVHGLVAEMRAKETHMIGSPTTPAEVASRFEQGRRAEQLDAITTTENLWVVADGTGAEATLRRPRWAASSTAASTPTRPTSRWRPSTRRWRAPTARSRRSRAGRRCPRP